MEMQIQADSNGKVALDDITQWANCCTKCHGNTISCLRLLTHYASGGEFFTGNYILWHPPHSCIIFYLHATTLILNLDLLNPKSIGVDRLTRTTTEPSLKF